MSVVAAWTDLMGLPVFAGLTREELERIAKLAAMMTYTKDQTLFLQGMLGNVFYVIKSGQVTIYKDTLTGPQQLSVLGRGEYFGELSLLEASPRTASAKVTADSVLLVLTKDSFDELLTLDAKVSSKLLLHFLKVQAARLQKAEARLAQLG